MDALVMIHMSKHYPSLNRDIEKKVMECLSQGNPVYHLEGGFKEYSFPFSSDRIVQIPYKTSRNPLFDQTVLLKRELRKIDSDSVSLCGFFREWCVSIIGELLEEVSMDDTYFLNAECERERSFPVAPDLEGFPVKVTYLEDLCKSVNDPDF